MKTARPSHAEQMPAAAARRGPAIRLVVAVASLALLAAGCGGSSPARSTSQSPHSIIAAAFKFSSCNPRCDQLPRPSRVLRERPAVRADRRPSHGRRVAAVCDRAEGLPGDHARGAERQPDPAGPAAARQGSRPCRVREMPAGSRPGRLPRSDQPGTADPADGHLGRSRPARAVRPDGGQGLHRGHPRGDHRRRRSGRRERHTVRIAGATGATEARARLEKDLRGTGGSSAGVSPAASRPTCRCRRWLRRPRRGSRR